MSNAVHTLSPRDIRRIERHIAAADAAAFLHPVQRALLHRRGWLTMLAPRAAGGAELPLPEVVRLQEAVAAVDGSFGWLLTLCAGAGWFAGFLPPALAREVISARRACLGGSGAPTGIAEKDGDGYRISGAWEYASGAPIATQFTLNAVLHEDGRPLRDEHGAPRIRAFVLPAEQVQVITSWHCIGMRASGTHSFRIENQWVHQQQGFAIAASAATADGPLYQFPFYSLAEATLAANLAGMARHFLTLAQGQLQRRKHPVTGVPLHQTAAVMDLLGEHQQRLAAGLACLMEVVEHCWAIVVAGKVLSTDDMVVLRTSALGLVNLARAAVAALYPYCGLYAAQEGNAINRVWRDFHTASQHPLLWPEAVVEGVVK